MIDNLIAFSIKNKLIILMLTLVWIIWGVYSLTQLPIDAVPDITNNQVQLITQSPNYSAQEVERFITAPLEFVLGNVQKVEEIRSISRLGISVITIVFEDGVDIYLARQWVAEQIKTVSIPPEMGQPEMAPVTTGLGEIYQYVLRPKAGYAQKYNAMELRTLQDWLVKRQLTGIEGIVDVSSFGGFVKQYEVAIKPEELRAYGLTLDEVYQALQANNQNTGGSYIEKNSQAYFIRGEGMVSSKEDIAQIVVKNVEGTPILIKNIAEVRFGNAVRYGAMSQDGKGEVVGGIVMMLKGANSANVIERVKERVAQIQTSLPEGVEIKAFLDRSELVNRAISTVQTNLIEGGLIVIFVLVLFLGNVRAGLVVASVIPLALLFALGMMNVFGVSANLMSLGAIDFGLVVDGAVIIVEAIIHRIYHTYPNQTLSQDEMDATVLKSSVQIRKSAAFGEIIILMVYLPILTLTGIEGKMFSPMAKTVGFAILGALILSLTYVPAMAALALNRKIIIKKNFSDRMIEFFQSIYRPVLVKALRGKVLVVSMSVVVLVFSLGVFSQLGGEFIPKLDEGDMALEMRIPVGSGINQTIKVATQMEAVLLKFPEVISVVSKAGTSEIPTDPMPLEAGDLIVVLKDKSEWTTAKTKDELIEKMQEALAIIPGATVDFQQPIEMRFNELITGIKSDVAVQIYGEDLSTLAQKAQEVANHIRNINGIADLKVETVEGALQMKITYQRAQIAQYGLTIEDLNRQIRMAFAGEVAGQVYEGERRFDLVIRYAPEAREGIQSLENLYVDLPNGGGQIPMSQVANIDFVDAPVQISRENTRRRITVGLNVRGRDVESVVNEIQARLKQKVSLPAGYYFKYGGQFENLQKAKNRLMIAVPLSLGLIFVLLYFTFGSIKQSALIFTAIPFSAIGGIFALWLRGMPFSISAGVGFIALFGVAVLNGIVLIGYFNDLEEEGIHNIYKRILEGTQVRLRPVLMTATVASLGFFPMAFSSGAGAEVQKPLATVVIGGLFTATLLTLIVIPILYSWIGGRNESMQFTKNPLPKTGTMMGLLLGMMLLGNLAQAQNTPQEISLEDALTQAYQNNESLKIADSPIQQASYQAKHNFTLNPLDIQMQFGNINNADTDVSISAIQSFALPSVYRSKKEFYQAQSQLGVEAKQVTKNELTYQVKQAYYQWLFLYEKMELIRSRDSLLQDLKRIASLKVKAGETSPIEQSRAALEAGQIQQQLQEIEQEIQIQMQILQNLLNTKEDLRPRQTKMTRPQNELLSIEVANNPTLNYLQQSEKLQLAQSQWYKSQKKPSLHAGYFNMREAGTFNRHVVIAGLSIPIGRSEAKNVQEVAQMQADMISQEREYKQRQLTQQLKVLQDKLLQNSQKRAYYEGEALTLAKNIQEKTRKSYRLGEIDYYQFAQTRQEVFLIEQSYLQTLLTHYLLQSEMEYLAGK